MAPDERRAAILDAAAPLLRERGAQVSTRELAEAAGVAEGTLFRVFPDKRSLLRAAVARAMDPAPLLDELARIDLAWPVERRIARVVVLVADRMDGILPLVMALHGLSRGDDAEHSHEDAEAKQSRDALVLGAVADVLAPDVGRLRVSPLQAAGLIRGAVLGQRLPGQPDGARAPTDVLADCLTHGLVTPAPAAPARPVGRPGHLSTAPTGPSSGESRRESACSSA